MQGCAIRPRRCPPGSKRGRFERHRAEQLAPREMRLNGACSNQETADVLAALLDRKRQLAPATETNALGVDWRSHTCRAQRAGPPGRGRDRRPRGSSQPCHARQPDRVPPRPPVDLRNAQRAGNATKHLEHSSLNGALLQPDRSRRCGTQLLGVLVSRIAAAVRAGSVCSSRCRRGAAGYVS